MSKVGILTFSMKKNLVKMKGILHFLKRKQSFTIFFGKSLNITYSD